MKRTFRLTGALLCLALLLTALPALAAGEAPVPEGVTAVAILIDGQVFSGKNERGETVKPFAYDGTTYVPIRALGQALKYEVGWDGATSSVTVTTDGTAKPLVPDNPGKPAAPVAGQIAPAIDVPTLSGGYDTSSRAGVYIPHLGAATGGVFSSDQPVNSDGNNMDTFHNGYPREESEAVEVLREYYDAICALPYFEAVEKLNEKNGFWRCSFRYTGTGAVKKDLLKSFSGDVCDFDIYLENGGRNIHLQYAKGLQIVDTGLRLSISAEGSANFQVVGSHLTDAYQYQNGVYQNVGGELSVKSGECALLVNGEKCKGTVEFITQYPKERNAADKFTVSGFRRSDWIQFAFPMNYVQGGDVYTVEKFVRQDYWPFGATDLSHQWGFAVSAQNGQDPVMPLDNDKNLFAGCNVRVLQWDKTGDTVVYFAAGLTLNGSPYTVEGLLAAPNRTAEEERPSGSSSGEKDCWYCGGSGTCPTCGGSGRVSNWMPGTTHTFLDQNCTDCYRDGKCRFCNGTGRE